MHAVILHGGTCKDVGIEAIHSQLCEILQTAAWTTTTYRLEEMVIHPCVGCFSCWLRTPGECHFADEGRTITRAFIQSDLRIYLTPISFGGYSGLLKTAIDRMIPNISPLFEKVNGEMHHCLRYPNVMKFLVVGWQQQANAGSAEIFSQLIRRNAINMHAPNSACTVLTAAHSAEEQGMLLNGLLGNLEEGR